MKRNTLRFREISEWLVLLVILVLINIILSNLFLRWDLTEDKRYSISDASKEIMANIQDKVFVEVYLEGEFPAGFKRLQTTIKETLEQFRSISGDKLEYRFVNPAAAPDAKTRNEVFNQLANLGLQPTNLMVKEGMEQVQKIIFPGAIVRAGSKEIAIQLLKGNQSAPPAERLNQSVEGVEYELANGIKLASQRGRKNIAVLSGHGEYGGKSIQDLGLSLKQYYNPVQVDLRKTDSLIGYDLAIMARPTQEFSDFDQFKLDQFMVKGGKLLLFQDGIRAELDSIQPDGSLAFPYTTNLDDLFFRWGFRVNADLVLDMNCGAIPLVVGVVGDKPETRLVPWRYFPIFNSFGKHPIVKNMDAVYGKFVSTIDTAVNPALKKTPLLLTSKYSRLVTSPVRLSFNEARLNPQPEQYKLSFLPVSYLIEGQFVSLFQNRMVPEAGSKLGFKTADKPGKIVVVGDGDLPRNDSTKRGEYFALGYDRFLQNTFANKDFILNAISYLLDANGVILAKNKTIALRPLDKPRINKEKWFWQAINLVVPVLVLIGFGIIRLLLRKRKYALA